MSLPCFILPAVLLAFCMAAHADVAVPAKPFVIEIVDDQTGRGVPLVELETVDRVRFFTDSAGLVAIDDPVLLGQKVFFTISSHGYEFPADGFGFRGKAVDCKPGESVTLKIRRKNIAERLYRITGPGIYRDTVIAGRKAPIAKPLVNALVNGQDSAQLALFHGKIWWFFGDTQRFAYPLGHFGMAGATSLPPDQGGLDPSVGVDLNYFTDDTGFSRPMIKQESGRPKWADGFIVLPDEKGVDRLVAFCQTMQSLEKCIRRELMVLDEGKNTLEPIAEIPMDQPLHPISHPIRVEADGKPWVYYPNPFPLVRVKPEIAALKDPSAYQGYTCLASGSRYAPGKPSAAKIDRDEKGQVRWGWKPDTSFLRSEDLRALVKAGVLKTDEIPYLPKDVETKQPVWLHVGSLNYNPHRKKYIAIGQELFGKTSVSGEIWYTEADQPEGPWLWARKIVTHNNYGFYNPVHHTFFDQQRGRVIYFQGTYTLTFDRKTDPTPRYEYNQIMYRLDLDDPRLKMP